MVPQNVTETIMQEQLKALGHRVEFGCELLHFTQTPHTVTAYVAGSTGEEVIIAHYLTGADGGKSFVRKKLGVNFSGCALGIHALVADVSLSGLTRDVWHHFNNGDMARMITICPLAGFLSRRAHGFCRAQKKSYSTAMNRNVARSPSRYSTFLPDCLKLKNKAASSENATFDNLISSTSAPP
ncbi:hypothetical protein DKU39_12050 [Salmonella enterica subsp. houtenae]|nr:hypothetical protein [Salmonella enterica subsp. houtenae]